MRTIPQILEENAGRWPEQVALVSSRRGRDRELTFSELQQASAAFAERLQKAGIRKGGEVLVFVPMSLELYVCLLGIFQLGAVAVFIDPSTGWRHVADCCRMLPPVALVAPFPVRVACRFLAGLRKIPNFFAPPDAHAGEHAGAFGATVLPDDPALITFTSGSTGKPKAAVRSHRFLVAQHVALQRAIELEPGEIDLTTLPIFVLANLASGVTSVLAEGKISSPGFIEAGPVARQIERLKTSRTGGSPAFYERVAECPDSLAGFRKIYTGGAPVFPSVLQRLQAIAHKGKVVAVYGSTEAEPIAHIATEEIDARDWDAMRAGKGLLAGSPVAEITLRIIADQWGHPVMTPEPLPANEIGEIIVTGDHVLKGYLHGRGDEETKVRIDGEIWHRTGDAGYCDTEGRLWLMGRCAAKIRDAHGELYPFAVECLAMTIPGIRRAALVSHGDKRILVVEGRSRLAEKEIDLLHESLRWASLHQILPMTRIPVDLRHNSKINYPKLRKRLLM